MVRKSAIENIGRFPIGIKSGEDLLTWASLATEYKIAYSRKTLAIFNVEGYNIYEKPKRIPPTYDYVGIELNLLLEKYKLSGLRKYNSQWHKMRASIFLRSNLSKLCLNEILLAMKYNILNYKLYIYILLLILPFKRHKLNEKHH